jgi:rRNA maturation RNase YbeY
MRIEIANRQRAARVSAPGVRTLVRFLMAKAGRANPGAVWADVSVALMDDAGIAMVNGRLLRRNAATDVIALNYAPAPGESGRSGEIWVNVERALASCGRAGWDASRELALYLAHGCDHLHDADDSHTRGRKRMRARELRWLRQAARDGLTCGIVLG